MRISAIHRATWGHTGDVELAGLRLKLEEGERREREREAKIKAASDEMEKLRHPKKGFTDEDREKVVAEVDRILGIKKAKKVHTEARRDTENL